MISNTEIALLKEIRHNTLEQILAGLIHNLNTPLNTIMGYAQLGKNRHPEFSEFEKITKAVVKIDTMLKRLNEILDLHQMQEKRLFSLHEIIEYELEFLNHSLFFKNEVEISFSDDSKQKKLWFIYSDIAFAVNLCWEKAKFILEQESSKNMRIVVTENADKIMLSISVCHSRAEKEMNDFKKQECQHYNSLIDRIIEPYNACFEIHVTEHEFSFLFHFPKGENQCLPV